MASKTEKSIPIVLSLGSILVWVSLKDIPPDIAYYPKALVFCLFGCSLILLVQLFFSRKPSKPASESSGFSCARLKLELVGSSILYIIVLSYFGFITSSMIFLIVLMRRLGVRNWLSIAGVSVATVFLVYLAFEKGLMVSLPDGYSVWSLFY